jgi:adenylate cyclase
VSGEYLRQRLAAILVADAVGYSALMAADERAALAALDNARAVFRTQVESNQGRVIDMAGDSILAVFETAVGAVNAAIAIQAEIERLAENAPPEQRMRYRIGVHLGDIIEKPDGTAYGDGINVAARIQSLAAPGGVLVSLAIRGAVRNRIAATFQDEGEHHVKNIPEPVRTFRVIASAGSVPPESRVAAVRPLAQRRWPMFAAAFLALVAVGAWSTGAFDRLGRPAMKQSSGTLAPMSLVIGHFNATGQSAAAERLSQTMGRDLATSLGAVEHAVKVIAVGTSTDPSSTVDLREAARRAGARYVVDGDVGSSSDQLLIALRLINTQDGSQVWSSRFELPISDTSLDTSAAGRRLVGGLASGLLNVEGNRVLRIPVEQLDASELVVRGRAAWGPASSLANALEVRKLADAALKIDPNHVQALLLALAAVDYVHDVDPKVDHDTYVRENDEFSARAVAVDPGNASAWGWRSQALQLLGNWNAPLEASEREIKFDPFEPRSYSGRAWLMSMLGRPAEALIWADKAMSLRPSNPGWVLSIICEAHLLNGQPEKAVEACERASGLLAPDVRPDLFLPAAYANAGDMAQASAALKTLLQSVPGYTVAQLKAKRYSVHPEYQKIAEQYWYAGLRRAGLPEK